MPAVLTRHAARRASERLGLGVMPAQKRAAAALQHGLQACDTAGRLKRWIQHQEHAHHGNRLRIHGVHVFVFGAQSDTVITILRLPNEHHRAALRRQHPRR